MQGLAAWSAFAVCGGAIAVAGAALCREAHVIARRTGLAHGWIGLTLLAAVTSLPELAVGVTSVAFAGLPEIAVADVLGSCLFNMAILGAMLAWVGDEGRGRRASAMHFRAAAYCIALLGIAAAGLALHQAGFEVRFGHVGYYTPAIAVGYLLAMHGATRRDASDEDGLEPDVPERTLAQAGLRYAGAAIVVAAAGSALPFLSERIVATMGWSQSFFGTLFVGAATSLPEVAVTVAAVRSGAIEMALGNLLGSNLFDLAVLAVDDVLYFPGPLLAAISPAHGIAALAAAVMTALPLLGATRRVGLSLLGIYLAAAFLLYRAGA